MDLFKINRFYKKKNTTSISLQIQYMYVLIQSCISDKHKRQTLKKNNEFVYVVPLKPLKQNYSVIAESYDF